MLNSTPFFKRGCEKNLTITVFGWEFMLLCQWSNLKTRFTRCTCSFPQLFHSTFYWKICAFVQWCRCSSNILTVIFGYVCARARTQQRKKIWKTWSNVNTDIFEFRSFLWRTWKKKTLSMCIRHRVEWAEFNSNKTLSTVFHSTSLECWKFWPSATESGVYALWFNPSSRCITCKAAVALTA